MTRIGIIGGGIGGLCTAIALQQAGFDATVYEATSEFRQVGAGIGIAPNGINVLDRIGVADDVKDAGNVVTNGDISTHEGKLIMQLDVEDYAEQGVIDDLGVVLHRATLQEILLDHLPDWLVRLGSECVDVDPDAGRMVFADGSEETADLVVAADGIDSTVRHSLVPDTSPRYANEVAFRGVRDTAGLAEPDWLGERWGRGDRFGLTFIDGDRLYWYITLPATSSTDIPEYGPAELADRISHFGEDAVACVEGTDPSDLIRTPLEDLPPIDRWTHGSVTLLGDAAHGMTPNLGQGGSQAMEDAVCLSNMITQFGPTAAAFERYEAIRKPRVEGLCQASRRFGRIARIQHPILRWVRNTVLRHLPKFVVRRNLVNQTTPRVE